MTCLRLAGAFVLFLLVLFPASRVFAAIGKVIDVRQGASVTSGGDDRVMRAGMVVENGDVITTDGSGVVQILFSDETKIAIGPNTRMVLDVSMMRGDQAARNFAVKALGGSFRFISGNSRKSAYSITTPTATMGVRGTIFDVWVLGEQQSTMVILEGTVRMCGIRNRCSFVRGQCSMVATTPGGGVGRPIDNQQAVRALNNGFPFILSQSQLDPAFRADVGGCGSFAVVPTGAGIIPIRAVPVPKTPVTPDPPVVDTATPPSDPPPSPPTTEPPSPPQPQPPGILGFPGQSGVAGGNSRGQGNAVSDGQHGTGAGNGQGAANRGGNGPDTGATGDGPGQSAGQGNSGSAPGGGKGSASSAGSGNGKGVGVGGSPGQSAGRGSSAGRGEVGAGSNGGGNGSSGEKGGRG